MSRVTIPKDLQDRLRAFQRSKGLTDGEIGEILNIAGTRDGVLWIYGGDVPTYVVDAIERLVVPDDFKVSDPCRAVASTALRFGLAEKVELLEHGRGVVLHSGHFVDGVRLQIRIPAKNYATALDRGDAETWRFLRGYVDGYVAGYIAACLEASKAGKAVATEEVRAVRRKVNAGMGAFIEKERKP